MAYEPQKLLPYLKFFVGGMALGLLLLLGYIQFIAPDAESASAEQSASATPASWRVGELRPNGLRIRPSGASTNAQVLDPRQFVRPEVQRAYAIAYKIPEVLNKLYCWCRCENRGIHRSNLACFEDKMGVDCGVCRGTAEIAYKMTREGVTDAGKIQAAVDREWARDS